MTNVKKLHYPDDFIDQFICGNATDIMQQLPSASVDLVVTSPPYNLKNSTGNGMKDGRGGKWSGAALVDGYSHYGDNVPHEEYVCWQRACLREMLRVIPKNGAIFTITSGEYKPAYCKTGTTLFLVFPLGRSLYGSEKEV